MLRTEPGPSLTLGQASTLDSPQLLLPHPWLSPLLTVPSGEDLSA